MRNEKLSAKLIAEKHAPSESAKKVNGRSHDNFNSAVRFEIRGKFFFLNNQKFYLKGVTYGTFKPQDNGYHYPDVRVVEKDFAMMSMHGINTIRTYTVPPLYVLDLALQYGLYVMVGIPWEQHITFLDSTSIQHNVVKKVREFVLQCKSHPAVLCYAIGNEIPAPIVRWHGKRKIENFIKQLFKTAKAEDPNRLVTYVNYPTTEYLDLSFLDFYCFNVYLETPEKVGCYILKLHNLIGDKPLVLAEIGIDSLSKGVDFQALFFSWQIPIAFARGCAGLCVFSWTDEWWRGGCEIEDWQFGLVDRERKPKPALQVVHHCITAVPGLIEEDRHPFVSVVVCTYNGAATIHDCLQGILQLDYSNYEVIVVNDGSIDNVECIIKSYPVRLITTPNQGLSAARNTGLRHAQGEIIAYIDDDAFPDPQWLKYLVLAYESSTHAGIGGPNLPPADEGPIANCIANAPGGPVHVLLTDEIAEHIPGCNMSFKKEVLEEVGGFDPVFRTAGDDVDLCWRIQKAGYTIGFHPAALVWHRRRNSLKAYWKQQRGYGKAEALLEAKWPEKYNRLGHLAWGGRIYGIGITQALKFTKDRIYYGTWGTALFQSIYEPVQATWASIPLMPEWYLFIGVLGTMGYLGFLWQPLLWAWPLFIMASLVLVIQASKSAARYIAISNKKINLLQRLLIIGLHVIQPLARLYGRVIYGLIPWRTRYTNAVNHFLFEFRTNIFTYWSEEWRPAEAWLTDLEQKLKGYKLRVARGGDFDNYDLQIYNGLFTRMRVVLAIEEHGEGKQYLRLKCWRPFPIRKLLFLFTTLSLGILAPASFLSIGLAAICLFLIVRVLLEVPACLSCIYTAFKTGNQTATSVKKSVNKSVSDVKELSI
jgi:O-antigen biosynthesis protein